MKAGRPKAFDEFAVLEQAMDLFWRRGYKGAGMTELLRHMGISRQSLYDTFGSKRDLFLRVLEHYRATRLTQALALLEADGSRIEAVKAVVAFFEQLGRDPECRGCLVANAVVELGPSEDEQISSLLGDTLRLLQARVQQALEEAQAAGELAPGKSPRQIAGALTNAMVGMAVTGRLKLSHAGLPDVYAGTLAMLD